MSNLPDDWSWRAFDQHFGDDQPLEREEADFDPTPDEIDESEMLDDLFLPEAM